VRAFAVALLLTGCCTKDGTTRTDFVSEAEGCKIFRVTVVGKCNVPDTEAFFLKCAR
jgi:hypothetical protein